MIKWRFLSRIEADWICAVWWWKELPQWQMINPGKEIFHDNESTSIILWFRKNESSVDCQHLNLIYIIESYTKCKWLIGFCTNYRTLNRPNYNGLIRLFRCFPTRWIHRYSRVWMFKSKPSEETEVSRLVYWQSFRKPGKEGIDALVLYGSGNSKIWWIPKL